MLSYDFGYTLVSYLYIPHCTVTGKVYEVAFQGEDGKMNTVYTGELYGIGNKLWKFRAKNWVF
jgi:CRISPR/Cas system-associated protein Cas5 (RAMP superfamily)